MLAAILCIITLAGILVAASKASKNLEDWYEPDFKTQLFQLWSQND